ncbi:SbmA/BacA-like family transporter [Candidatus Puniceispirillum sp.]|nr:SbmA/BacA-like family transporter [Candidatus Puniceispirillum sp.]
MKNKKCSNLFDVGEGCGLLGVIVIVGGIYDHVQIDVLIHKWFGEFYESAERVLAIPNLWCVI